MSVDEYKLSCAAGSWLDDYKTFSVGQCMRKPTEYAVFQSGRVAIVASSERYAEWLCEGVSDAAICHHQVSQELADIESRKAQMWRTRVARSEARSPNTLGAIGAALSGMSNGMNAGRARSAPSTATSLTMTCLKSGEQVSGLNKICTYNCAGSGAATTIGSAELCPLTIER
jgi:hypothetical protein